MKIAKVVSFVLIISSLYLWQVQAQFGYLAINPVKSFRENPQHYIPSIGFVGVNYVFSRTLFKLSGTDKVDIKFSDDLGFDKKKSYQEIFVNFNVGDFSVRFFHDLPMNFSGCGNLQPLQYSLEPTKSIKMTPVSTEGSFGSSRVEVGLPIYFFSGTSLTELFVVNEWYKREFKIVPVSLSSVTAIAKETDTNGTKLVEKDIGLIASNIDKTGTSMHGVGVSLDQMITPSSNIKFKVIKMFANGSDGWMVDFKSKHILDELGFSPTFIGFGYLYKKYVFWFDSGKFEITSQGPYVELGIKF